MANIVIKPASGTLEFNTGVVAGSAVDTTLSGASRLTFDSGELNLVSYATGNLNRFTIDGSTSRLFSAYDQMSGSLMSINTIAGFPVFEAFSDNTIVLGKYGSKDFVSTGNKIGIGTAAPANKLEVFGTGDVSVRITTTGSAAATDFAALRFFQGGVQKGSVIANSGVLRIGAGDGIGVASGVYVNSTGSVGIGITSPAAKLDIVHDSGASTPTIYAKGGNGGTAIARFERIYGVTPGTTYVEINGNSSNSQLSIASATNTFAIGTNNSNSGFEIADNTTIGTNPRFVIDVNGNVGIGTTTPTDLLSIFQSSLATTTLRIGNNLGNANNAAAIVFSAENLNEDGRIEVQRDGSNTAGIMKFFTKTNAGASTERLRIDAVGNVGIGTTTPTQKLDLSGTLRISSAVTYSDPAVDNAGFINYNTGDGILTLSARSNGGNTFTAFRTSNVGTGSEKMRITNDGNVGIGTTSPVAKLTVIPTGQAFDGKNAMVAYFGRNTLSGYGSTFIRVATAQNTTGIAGNLEYTDIEHNSLGTGPFRYGTYGDTNIINGVARTDGIYGSINFVTSGSVKMTIAGGTGNGYVGIGTTTPASRLSLATHNAPSGGITFGTDTNLYRSSAGTLKTDAALIVVDSVFVPNNAGVANSNTSNNAFLRMNTGGALITRNIGSSDANPALIVQQVNSGSLGDILQLKNDASTVLTVQRVGNVGIGTTTPMAKLQVSGSILPVGHLAAGQDLGGQSNYWNTLYSNTANFYQNVNIDIGDFIVGTSDFVVRNAAGNVGVGTATPTGKLEVFGTGDVGVRITTSGNAAATDFAALRFFQGGVQKGSVIANSGVLRIGAGDGIGDSSGVYVNSAGSVGIGISPAYPLQIRKSGGAGSLAISVNNVMSQYGRDSLYLAIADDTSGVAGHAWYVRNTTATDNFAMGINNLGNVGIGTNRPTGKLEVLGAGDVSVRITTSGNDATTDFAALRFFQGGAQKGSVIANNSVLRLSAGTNLSGIFISDSGNVGINSIPTGANNVRFQVNGGVGSNVAALRFENCGLVLGGNLSDKTFSSWLPIQIDSSTTRYIPLYVN